MKIVYQINYIGGVGADRWISSGWKDAFEELGHSFSYLSNGPRFAERAAESRPDIIFLFPSDELFDQNNWSIFRSLRQRGTKIFSMVDNRFANEQRKVEFYKNAGVVDVFWGENEPEWMTDFTEKTGNPYVVIPLAANPKYHFLTKPVKKYQCDIVFLGAMMPFKREIFKKILLPLKKNYNVKIYGPNWTVKDNLMRLVALAARKLRMFNINQWIQKLRVTMPPEEENQLYSSAKICVNIHERGPEQKNHVFLNERGFKIPACGGFEICDQNLALRRYFSPNEVVMAEDDNDWFRKIEYYFRNDNERCKIQEAGTRRALRDHTYRQRIRYILKLAGY